MESPVAFRLGIKVDSAHPTALEGRLFEVTGPNGPIKSCTDDPEVRVYRSGANPLCVPGSAKALNRVDCHAGDQPVSELHDLTIWTRHKGPSDDIQLGYVCSHLFRTAHSDVSIQAHVEEFSQSQLAPLTVHLMKFSRTNTSAKAICLSFSFRLAGNRLAERSSNAPPLSCLAALDPFDASGEAE